MKINPSLEKDPTKYFMTLASLEISKGIEPIEILEPQFDLIEAYGRLDRAPADPDYPDAYRKIIDPGWEVLKNTNFEYISSDWVKLLTQPLKTHSKEIVKFLNFYIFITLDSLVESLNENWHLRGVEDDWRFYDLIVEYKYLDKSLKKHIKDHGADETFRRPCRHSCVCSEETKTAGFCEQTD